MADFTDLVDLISERVGGAALAANDEFFAPKENLLRASRAEFIEGKYTDRGKWMDGWETRRKRVPGYDWCILRLGIPGVIRGVDVDTSFFKGNFPAACAIEACALTGDPTLEQLQDAAWVEVLPRAKLQGHSQNLFPISHEGRWTHLRLNIYPDGGVARLRVYGEAIPNWRRVARLQGDRIDLASVAQGGTVVACNDMFFGSRHNLVMPGRSVNMGDGWETRRTRDLANVDWTIVKLGAEGTLASVDVDTNHFKGNFPDRCALAGCRVEEGASLAALTDPTRTWTELLPETKLRAHTQHFFGEELRPHEPVTHVRLSIYPDGGISRLRLYGRLSAEGFARAALRELDTAQPEAAAATLRACCGASAWVTGMLARRPFGGRASLLAAADGVWRGLGREDWLEGFRAHPRIGSRKDVAAKSGQEQAWTQGEQAGAAAAAADVLGDLASLNARYEERFGHIFIVCATGKSAEEMLAMARARFANDAEVELRNAAEEQRKITRIRLEKLLAL